MLNPATSLALRWLSILKFEFFLYISASKMKKIYAMLLWLFVFAAKLMVAQTINGGVYMTLDDYTNNKLAEEVECKKHSNEIFKKHDVFGAKKFVVINKGVKKTYLKNDIYGYRDCENRVWRFYNKQEYEILEAKNVYIYAIEKIVINGIVIERDPIYYFSDGPNGEIKKLTTANLKATYPNNQTLNNILDAYIETNQDIKGFDATRKTYIANYLYSEATK